MNAKLANMSVRAQLAGGFGILIVVAAIVIGVAVSSLSSLQRSGATVSQRAVPYLTNLSDAALAAEAAANDERGFLVTGELEAVSNRLRELVGRFRYAATG